MFRTYAAFKSAREEFRTNADQFVEFNKKLEAEIGDVAVEELRRTPDRALSWNDGLCVRWEAADGTMERNMGLLWQLNYLSELVAMEAVQWQVEEIASPPTAYR